jgi:uncharacterized phage-associated protein
MKRVDIHKMSEYVILFCHNLGVSISPLKLQKLLYYIQSWHIAKLNKSQLFDSLPEAWVNGPVYREVYDKFKTTFFRNNNITTDLEEIELAKQLLKRQVELGLNEDQLSLVNSVLEIYCKLSDERLVLLTHSEKPWNEARKGLSPIERSNNTLSIDTIYSYFNRESN